MKKLIPSFAMVIAGCAVQPLQPTPGETTKEPSPAPATAMMLPPVLQPSPGFSTTWAEIGYPFDARKIAACGPNEDDPNGLWALNADNTLWYSPNGGAAPSSWTYQATVPSAEYIVCDAALLYVFTTDKTIQATPGFPSTTTPFAGWASIGAWDDAHLLFGGLGSLGTLNLNGDFYYSSTDLTGVGPTEKFVVDGFTDPLIASGGDAYWALSPITPLAANSTTRVTSAGSYIGGAYVPSIARAFLLGSGALEYNDGLLPAAQRGVYLDGQLVYPEAAGFAPANGWNPLPTPASTTLIEESASDQPSGDRTLYALDSTYHLWQATFAETSCFDGVDNDNTGLGDGYDPSCFQAYAQKYCSTPSGTSSSLPSGFVCSSSFGTNTNGIYWTTCVNGEATSTWEGSSCNTQFCCGPQ